MAKRKTIMTTRDTNSMADNKHSLSAGTRKPLSLQDQQRIEKLAYEKW